MSLEGLTDAQGGEMWVLCLILFPLGFFYFVLSSFFSGHEVYLFGLEEDV